jgi:hypothetical protein
MVRVSGRALRHMYLARKLSPARIYHRTVRTPARVQFDPELFGTSGAGRLAVCRGAVGQWPTLSPQRDARRRGSQMHILSVLYRDLGSYTTTYL